MRGERMKEAVQQIRDHSAYAVTHSECNRALQADTPEAYRHALQNIVNGPNRNSEYAVNIDKAERALREDH